MINNFFCWILALGEVLDREISTKKRKKKSLFGEGSKATNQLDIYICIYIFDLCVICTSTQLHDFPAIIYYTIHYLAI